MLTIELNEASADSLYIQLYSKIKTQIIQKELKPGEKLPSKRMLASHLGVSVKTVENAYSQLLLEGYIYSQAKSGFYISTLDDYRLSHTIKKEYHTKYHETSYKVDLKSNKNNVKDFPMSIWSKLLRETLSYDQERLLETVPFNGMLELRMAIANHLKAFKDMDISPDQVLIGAGTEYLYNRLIQLLGRDRVYGVEDPGSMRIKSVLDHNDVESYMIPVKNHGLSMEHLQEEGVDIIHISPAHQFPLGYVMPIQERLKLLNWANEKEGRYIIEDDYDSEYRYRGIPVKPLYSIDIRGKVIYLNTFSKIVAPGIRISYMVLPEPLMERYADNLSFYSCSVSGLEQLALARFIEEGYLERYIHRIKKTNSLQHSLFMEKLKHSSIARKLTFIEEDAGYHFLLRINTDWSDSEIKNFFLSHQILVSMLSEYTTQPLPEYEKTLVINDSNLSEEQMDYFIDAVLQLNHL
ncbi:MAG: PLP-dependent aminotransferase family protein [Lachnospiraceae bacterium]|nr:PLP-dependent aminotransferase family protein [Lachnospiraceae bacterium]